MNISLMGKAKVIIDPNICSHCHVTNIPQDQWGCMSSETDDIPVFISAWQCVNVKCKKLFVTLHKYKNDSFFVFDRFLGPIGPKKL